VNLSHIILVQIVSVHSISVFFPLNNTNKSFYVKNVFVQLVIIRTWTWFSSTTISLLSMQQEESKKVEEILW